VIPLADGCLVAFFDVHTAFARDPAPMSIRDAWRPVPCGASRRWWFANSAVNSPAAYFPAFVAYGASRAAGGGVAGGLLAARLAALATYIALVWTAIRIAPDGRGVLFVVGVLPSSLALRRAASHDTLGSPWPCWPVALVLRLRRVRGQPLLRPPRRRRQPLGPCRSRLRGL